MSGWPGSGAAGGRGDWRHYLAAELLPHIHSPYPMPASVETVPSQPQDPQPGTACRRRHIHRGRPGHPPPPPTGARQPCTPCRVASRLLLIRAAAAAAPRRAAPAPWAPPPPPGPWASPWASGRRPAPPAVCSIHQPCSWAPWSAASGCRTRRLCSPTMWTQRHKNTGSQSRRVSVWARPRRRRRRRRSACLAAPEITCPPPPPALLVQPACAPHSRRPLPPAHPPPPPPSTRSLPAAGWNHEKRRLRKLEEAEHGDEEDSFRYTGAAAAGRTPLSAVREGAVLSGTVTANYFYHGAQVRVGGRAGVVRMSPRGQAGRGAVTAASAAAAAAAAA